MSLFIGKHILYKQNVFILIQIRKNYESNFIYMIS